MAHTRGGGIGNMCGSDDRTIDELVTELRQRVKDDRYKCYAELSSMELERLIDLRDRLAEALKQLGLVSAALGALQAKTTKNAGEA